MTIQICQYRFRKIDNLRSQFYRGPTIFHNSFPVYIGHIFINAQENVINLSCNEGGVKDGGSGLSLATALTLDPRARNLSPANYKITSAAICTNSIRLTATESMTESFNRCFVFTHKLRSPDAGLAPAVSLGIHG